MLNIPPLRNRPPRILQETVDPKPESRIIEIVECSTIEFSFIAEDPDVDDTLRVRWYVDYPLDTGFIDPEQTLRPSGKPVRDQAARLTINLAGNPGLPEAFLHQAGTHVVEALLFDGSLGEGRRPIPMTPATDGGVENPSYVVRYAWVVEALRACP